MEEKKSTEKVSDDEYPGGRHPELTNILMGKKKEEKYKGPTNLITKNKNIKKDKNNRRNKREEKMHLLTPSSHLSIPRVQGKRGRAVFVS